MLKLSESGQMIFESKSIGNRVADFFLTYAFYLLFLVIVVIGAIAAPVFMSVDNIMQIIYASTSILVVAAGVTFVIVSGNLDLSVGSVALTSLAFATLVSKQGGGFALMIITTFAAGLLFGLLNGFLIAYLRMNSVMTTLGMMIALRGLSLLLTRGGAQFYLREEFKLIKNIKILDIQLIIIVSVLILVVLHVVLRRTKFGTNCYAIGCNKAAAEKLGLPVRRTTLIMYVLSGVCAAFAGIIAGIKLGTYDRVIGVGMEFDVIAVCVIGGTSLLGGVGRILPGTLIGVLIIYLINNALAFFGANPFLYPFAKGLIIFLAMYVDSLKNLKRI